ncbi:hypothetical protein [Staphylococcus hominis]|uniref:hypothetical protein n=1 Tax=Staphylococcus hominis TaxID=1290 RepID=UPI00287878C1|nr:hypothetical protein [Staphylococcus hominis]MDS3838004.1 hypothetical protein [Staphylococcus hominis]
MKDKLKFIGSISWHWIAFVLLILVEFFSLTYQPNEKSEIDISYIDSILPTNNELILIFIVIDIIVFILCTLITISSFKSKSLNKRNNMNK